MTQDQIKQDYARTHDYASFEQLTHMCDVETMNKHINEVMKVYAMECLKLVSENVKITAYGCDNFGHRYLDGQVDGVSLENGRLYEINKKSITNEKNIIK